VKYANQPKNVPAIRRLNYLPWARDKFQVHGPPTRKKPVDFTWKSLLN